MMTLSNTGRRTIFWFLTILLVMFAIEVGCRIIEQFENSAARRKNPFVESVNPVPAFKIVEYNGIKTVVRSGFHPLMNTALRPFNLVKPPGGLRIFVLGGSAAAGWPYADGDTNISALLERKLRLLYPGRSIEVINAAAGTYASHRVALILEEVLNYNPDYIFLYNGNNEFLENLVYRPITPPKPWVHSAVLRLGYRYLKPRPKIDVKNFDISAQIPNTLAFAFAKSSLYREDPRQFQLLLQHYRFNINEMITATGAAKVPIFLVTCPVNLKDWVPNVSRHRNNLTSDEKKRWTDLFREGVLAIESKHYSAAIVPLRAAIALDDEYAESHYYLGHALRHTGKLDEGKLEYVRALERDAFPFRELPEFQQILRDIADKRNVPLIDVIPALEAVAGDGILGDDVMVDYVHLTEQSQEIVAHEMLKSLYNNGVLNGIALDDISRVRIKIPKTFYANRDIAAADLNYSMAMTMQQYQRIDVLYEEAIRTFSKAAEVDPSFAVECRNRILLYKEIHPVVLAYRDLLRAEKLGLREKYYSQEESQRIYNMYREMIRQVKTPGLTNEEFSKKTPSVPFSQNK